MLRESVGDDGHEAYTVIVWGGIMSRESFKVTEAEAVPSVEGNMCGAAMRGADAPPESETTSRQKGTRRNLGGLMAGRSSLLFRTASGR